MENLIGKTFGMRTVISYAFKRSNNHFWLCRCMCGKESPVIQQDLKNGKSISCKSCAQVKHNSSHSPEYRVWNLMIQRCTNPKGNFWHRYGGRGIQVCSEWLDFSVFQKWALSNGYALGLQIDRINNNGNYCPENCRWVTPKENSRNSSRARLITAWGETKCLTEWMEDSRAASIHPVTVHLRLKRGWSPEDSISLPR